MDQFAVHHQQLVRLLDELGASGEEADRRLERVARTMLEAAYGVDAMVAIGRDSMAGLDTALQEHPEAGDMLLHTIIERQPQYWEAVDWALDTLVGALLVAVQEATGRGGGAE